MFVASRPIWRVILLAIAIVPMATAPCFAKGKRSQRATPAPVALPCLSYAPTDVDVIGVIQRESFEKPAMEDLFVDPNDPEVEPISPTSTPGSPTASAPPTVGPDFIGPMLPANTDEVIPTMEVDPAMLRAKPVKRPLATETVWVLTLLPNICVDSDPSDKINTPEKRVSKLQLVVDKSTEASLRPLQKKKVLLQGQLFHAVSRGHYLPVLINVATIRPPEWKPEVSELEPLTPVPPLQPLPKFTPH